MKRVTTIFLQVVLVAIGLLALGVLIWFPLTEGRATNLDLLSIYFDPFILYAYAASALFFIGLFKVFKLLGYIRENRLFSLDSVRVLKSIKHYALALSLSIVLAAVYIKIFHHPDDDPAGFLALCILAVFFLILIAITAAKYGVFLRKSISSIPKRNHLI